MTDDTPEQDQEQQTPEQQIALEEARVALATALQEVLDKHADRIAELTKNPGYMLLQESGRLAGFSMYQVFVSCLEQREQMGFKTDGELIKWLFESVTNQTMYAFIALVEGEAVEIEQAPSGTTVQ